MKFKTRLMKKFTLNEFPCECGLKRVMAHDKHEYVHIFNESNKFSSDGMHRSNYGFRDLDDRGKPVYSSAIVGHVTLDTDLQDFGYDNLECYLNASAIHLFAENYDIQQAIVKSGNGFHCYVGVDSTGIEDNEKDEYIRAAIDLMTSITGARVCDSCAIQPTKRMIRSVGSIYTKRKKKKHVDTDITGDDDIDDLAITAKKTAHDAFIKKNGFDRRFCTSLTDDDIHSGYMNIFRISTKQSFDVHVMGTRRIVLASLRPKPKILKRLYIDEIDGEFDTLDNHGKPMTDIYEFLENCGVKRSEIAPCIKILMKEKMMRYTKRFFLVVYLDSINLSKKEIRQALSMILSKEKFHHAYDQEDDKPGYIIDKRHAGFDYNITCGSMKKLGYCVDTCTLKRVLPF